MDDYIKKVKFGSNERVRNMQNLYNQERNKIKGILKENGDLQLQLKKKDEEIRKIQGQYNALMKGKFRLLYFPTCIVAYYIIPSQASLFNFHYNPPYLHELTFIQYRKK